MSILLQGSRYFIVVGLDRTAWVHLRQNVFIDLYLLIMIGVRSNMGGAKGFR